jgi:hypothetical protein
LSRGICISTEEVRSWNEILAIREVLLLEFQKSFFLLELLDGVTISNMNEFR